MHVFVNLQGQVRFLLSNVSESLNKDLCRESEKNYRLVEHYIGRIEV